MEIARIVARCLWEEQRLLQTASTAAQVERSASCQISICAAVMLSSFKLFKRLKRLDAYFLTGRPSCKSQWDRCDREAADPGA